MIRIGPIRVPPLALPVNPLRRKERASPPKVTTEVAPVAPASGAKRPADSESDTEDTISLSIDAEKELARHRDEE